ncbi:MAG: SdpI family protein [Kiritimatiellae bacterium]|nr:SdpI family protein [Kiritimatiellia bacterium]
MRIEPLYKDSLVTITNGSITFHWYGIGGSDREIALKDIREIRVLKPTVWNGKWRIQGTGTFRTWFPEDAARPTRNAIFVAVLKRAWWRIGFTVEDAARVLSVLSDKGLVKERVVLPPVRSDAGSTKAYERVMLCFVLLIHLCFGPLLLGGGIYFRTHLPEHINGAYGHRTAMSIKSQEAWDEAQKFSANAMIVAAVAVIAFQVFSVCKMSPGRSLFTSWAVFMAALFAICPLTEWHLRRHFDDQGRKIAVQSTRR